MPNRARGLTESLAQDAYFLRYHKGRSVPEIAGLLQLHPRTVVRYIKRVEAQEVPWPPLRYRVFTQVENTGRIQERSPVENKSTRVGC